MAMAAIRAARIAWCMRGMSRPLFWEPIENLEIAGNCSNGSSRIHNNARYRSDRLCRVARHAVTGRSNRPRWVLVRPTSQLRAIEGLNVERVYGDMRDKSSLTRALDGVRQVFHVAADYRLWAKNPDEIYESNVVGTRNLLAASREIGVERFVYTSSVATIAVPS